MLYVTNYKKCNMPYKHVDHNKTITNWIWIMQFESFHWVMSHYTMLYEYGKHTCDFLGHFYVYFSLVFYILGTFSIKQLLHSCLWI